MIDIYEYKYINVSLAPDPKPYIDPTIESEANRWAKMGWRTVAVIPSRGVGYADCLLIERKMGCVDNDV